MKIGFASVSIAMVGYSHGGGSTYNLSRRIAFDQFGQFIIGYNQYDEPIYRTVTTRLNTTPEIVFTAYIDAIQNDTWSNSASETRRPESSDFHANFYQTNSLYIFGSLNGAPSWGDIEQDCSDWGYELDGIAITPEGSVAPLNLRHSPNTEPPHPGIDAFPRVHEKLTEAYEDHTPR